MRELPEEAAARLSQAVLMAVDKALVYEEMDRAWSELLVYLAARALGPLPVRPSMTRGGRGRRKAFAGTTDNTFGPRRRP